MRALWIEEEEEEGSSWGSWGKEEGWSSESATLTRRSRGVVTAGEEGGKASVGVCA